jgi:hypothetical protein
MILTITFLIKRAIFLAKIFKNCRKLAKIAENGHKSPKIAIIASTTRRSALTKIPGKTRQKGKPVTKLGI